ncbi:arylsulfatase [Pontibacter sp. G13]|uniref:arylsulfatase n=1 Tax=Pontibacter sp. G13 TaxID=3074898 RepID=UPI00288A5C10|nr:arylsulfatase [Pontibacter sp. G13]WNJ19667.1 arylsulfatase [Pontibacter sp. G13]
MFRLLRTFCGFVLLATLTHCTSTERSKASRVQDARPNIIIVLVDDMGFSDLGSYGGEIQTPNIDQLATGGIRFTQFYNTARCCPTRASLLTGLYPHQAGIGQMTGDQGAEFPGYRGQLKQSAVTIAEVLKSEGYQTGMVGKWHVSNTQQQKSQKRSETPQLDWLNHQDFADADFGPLEAYPTARGFDKYYGNIWGVVNFFDPFSLVNGTTPVASVPDDYYHTDALSDSAVSYVKEFAQQDAPFFLYLAHTAPHWPLHALPEDIDKYADTYTEGWDAIRSSRFERMKELGILGPEVSLPDHQRKIDIWAENPHQAYDARKMAVHAAMIDRIDQGMGRLLATLEETNQLDHTLILFLSDNGASPEMPKKAGFDRNSETRDGQQVIYTTNDKTIMPGGELTYAGIGDHWANVANTPFRYWKARTFEGGICTPLIAHWPNGITQQAGSINKSPGHVIDLMATCLDVAGATYPRQFNGHDITPMEGKSLAPIFTNGSREGHESIFFEHFWSSALRMDKWKLVALPDGVWELYDLDADRTEQHNLIDQFPEVAEKMKARWQEEATRTQVFPGPKMPKHVKKQRKAAGTIK